MVISANVKPRHPWPVGRRSRTGHRAAAPTPARVGCTQVASCHASAATCCQQQELTLRFSYIGMYIYPKCTMVWLFNTNLMCIIDKKIYLFCLKLKILDFTPKHNILKTKVARKLVIIIMSEYSDIQFIEI